MVTGYDIIFFWVARMVVSGMEQMKEEPFKTVFYPWPRARCTRAEKCPSRLATASTPSRWPKNDGADALRFNLITGNSSRQRHALLC